MKAGKILGQINGVDELILPFGICIEYGLKTAVKGGQLFVGNAALIVRDMAGDELACVDRLGKGSNRDHI